MNNPIMFFMFLPYLIIALYFGYISWFKPEKYFAYSRKAKKRVQAWYSFLPQKFFDFVYLEGQPKLSIWWARVASLLGIFIGLIGVIAAIWSPFVK